MPYLINTDVEPSAALQRKQAGLHGLTVNRQSQTVIDEPNSLLLCSFLAARLFSLCRRVAVSGRKIAYRTVLLRDLTALGVYNVLFAVVVVFTDRIPVPNYVPAALMGTPLALKLVLFFIVEDFGLYWVHRLMHTNYFWRTHKWHHYPKYMYWLAGVRTAIPHIILFNLTFILARPLLRGAPIWIFQLILAEHTFRNNWMHMNVAWKLSWLEWFVVTPRYHQIHHSDDPQHYRSNMASLLTIWDRLFGTIQSGSGEKATYLRN